MASKINADEFVDREGEGKPTLPKGVVLSGVTTITTAVVAENEVANSTGINAGIITSTHFKGNLTGDVNAGIVTVTSQTVVGSAVTISASGIDIGAGVITATSYAGTWGGTGIGATIMVWEYNPDPYVSVDKWGTGIGITFNQKIKAGSGNITLRKDSSSGTVVENFGIGSSVTISSNSLTIDPTNDLSENQVYYLELPSGVITNMAGDSYVGTAYTFSTAAGVPKLWTWGGNDGTTGVTGLNNVVNYSSPVQLPGTTWSKVPVGFDEVSPTNIIAAAIKTGGELYTWGANNYGQMGVNNTTEYSSPVQVPGTTWAYASSNNGGIVATKTDGTLWSWGYGGFAGFIGENARINRSSPIQVGSATDWDTGDGKCSLGNRNWLAIKTNGEMWGCGNNYEGIMGRGNSNSDTGGMTSSPVQTPGTNWNTVIGRSAYWAMGGKTDGTLWVWGSAATDSGRDGSNGAQPGNSKSSPVQVSGTTWVTDRGGYFATGGAIAAIKTDGTLWAWGGQNYGELGQNETNVQRSSPIQIGSDTNWSKIGGGQVHFLATKTDGTLWTWGRNQYGQLGKNEPANTNYSSPVQIPGTTWTSDQIGGGGLVSLILEKAAP